MNDQKTKLVVTVSTILLFFALVAVILLLIPKLNQLKLVADQVNSKVLEYETKKLELENMEELNQTVNQYKEEAQKLSVALPSAPRSEDALVELSSAASSSNLEITSAEIKEALKGSVKIEFSTKGTYENQIVFLDKLKKSLRPSKIEQLTITRVDDDILADFEFNFPYYVKTSSEK